MDTYTEAWSAVQPLVIIRNSRIAETFSHGFDFATAETGRISGPVPQVELGLRV